MKKKSIFLLQMLFLSNICKSQELDSTTINGLINKEIPYVNKNGKPLTELSLEAYPAKIVFYSFVLNKNKKSLKIKGRVFDPSIIGDTVGTMDYIFLATPKKNKLIKLRDLGLTYERLLNDKHDKVFPYRTGDFRIEFSFKENEILFFNFPLNVPLEYDIGKLLE